MDTHCHFREAVQDGLVGRVFFFFLFCLFSLRVLHVYQRCGHLLYFSPDLLRPSLSVLPKQRGYLPLSAAVSGGFSSRVMALWGKDEGDRMLFPWFQYIMRKPLEVDSLLLCLMSVLKENAPSPRR